MLVQSINCGSKTEIRAGFVAGKYNYDAHIHQFSEIVYCKEGELEITVDGKTELMRAGDIAVIAPFRVHGFSTPEYTNRWILVFSDDIMQGIIPTEKYYMISEQFVFHAEPELIAYIEKHITDSNEYAMKLTDELIMNYKIVIGAIYEEFFRKIQYHEHRNKTNAVSAILLYIAQHYKEKISLASIGAELGYSAKYVSACISTINRFNLSMLVNSFRVDCAKQLLVSTDSKVIDIGMECGYNNEKSFHRAFLAIAGLTPSAYRRKKRRVLENAES